MALADHIPASSCSPRTLSYVDAHGDQTIVWLRGELDAATVDELFVLLTDAIALSESDVIVDLSGVDFIGAAPVNALMRARHFLEQHSRALVLRAPSGRAQIILDVCGIHSTPAPAHADGVVISGAARALASFVVVPASARASPGTNAPAPNPRVRPESASPANIRERVSRAR